MLGQLSHLVHDGLLNSQRTVVIRQVQQHHEPRRTFHQGADR